MRFKDKIVLVTGGTDGIGRACALSFASEGARVTICGRRPDRGREMQREAEDARLRPALCPGRRD